MLSVLLYGVEATPLRDSDVDRLAVFESRCLRKILGISWDQHVSTEELLRRAGRVDGKGAILPLGRRLRNFRLRWLGHLSRMRGERLPRLLFYAAPKELKSWKRFRVDNGWKRRPGGQRQTWQRLVESDLDTFSAHLYPRQLHVGAGGHWPIGKSCRMASNSTRPGMARRIKSGQLDNTC